MDVIILTILIIAYAGLKALSDSRMSSTPPVWVTKYWHTAQTGYNFALAAMAYYTAYNDLGVLTLVACWLIGQVLFEGVYSVAINGYWYGPYSRSLPIEWMPVRWSKWIDENVLPVEWRQIRFEGWLAPAWDVFRLIVAGILII